MNPNIYSTMHTLKRPKRHRKGLYLVILAIFAACATYCVVSAVNDANRLQAEYQEDNR